MKKLLSFCLVVFLIAKSSTVNAQSYLGSWNVANVRLQFNDKWALVTEAQLRSIRIYDRFFYYEYKTGIQYKIDKNFSLLAGVGNYNTFQENGNFKTPMVNDEIRTWFQLTMNQYLNRIKIEHRYRAEQRFLYAGFRNRFRYRLNVVVPLNNNKIGPKTFYTYLYDEVFLTNKQPYFERNRFSVGGGYQFNKAFTLQAGILNQVDYKIGSELSRNFLQVNLLFDLLWHPRKTEQLPATID